MKKQKYRGIEKIKERYGLMFVAPWILGFIIFFLIPVIQSILYAFSDITLTSNGVSLKFIGIESFKYYLFEDPLFIDEMMGDLGNILYSLPIILLVSVVLALLLNKKIPGRLFFRALFFLPVIIASGVVLGILFQTTDKDLTSAGINAALTDSMFSVSDVISWLNLPDKVADYVKVIINNVFDLLWSCGVQTVLFIAGLQSIPGSLYEASTIEGATKWEEFWFITFPMLNNVILLVMFYTMVDIFTSNRRKIIYLATQKMNSGIYDTTSTMLWIYFTIISIFMICILLIYNKLLMKRFK